jgi:ankyrin repeat protein
MALGLHKYKVSKMLIEMGADLSGQACSAAGQTQGYTVFHYAVLAKEYADIFHSLMRRRPDWTSIDTPVHPIHIAVATDNRSALELILQYQEKYSSQKNEPNSSTPPVSSEKQTVQLSQNRFSLPNLSIRHDDLNWKWSLNVSDTLTTKRRIQATPLHIASRTKNRHIAEILLAHGAVVDILDENRTPLHVAAAFGSLDVAELLLKHGANPNARDNDLFTPMILAARFGHADIVLALKNAGADSDIQDDQGSTALSYGLESNNPATIAHLLQDRYSLHFKNKWGDPNCLVAFMKRSPRLLTFLLNADVDLTAVSPVGSNVLLICSGGRETILKLLLRRLPPCEVKKFLNLYPKPVDSPLYSSATQGKPENIEMLLDAGAELDMVGGSLGTALMGACGSGRIETVKTLVRRGAQINYLDCSGLSVSAIKAAKYHSLVIQWLLVDRHTEQRRICDAAHLSTQSMEARSWAGTTTVEIFRPRPTGVSWIDYLKERTVARRRYFGKVHRPIESQ